MTRGSLSPLQAVLFDMDGTLLDSEKVWDVALADLANWLGGRLSLSARRRMVGSNLTRSITIMHTDLGIEADPEASGAYLLSRTEELFRTSLVFRPGARELLDSVATAEVPAALVTSTHRSLTEIALDVIGRHYFAASVCGDEVRRPKPHAEPYLQAAQRLGVDPRRSVAVEDSLLGVTSAEAAGCVLLAVPSEVAIPRAPGRAIRSSLVGVDACGLAALVAARLGDPPADETRARPTQRGSATDRRR